jgi:hypothetical protein
MVEAGRNVGQGRQAARRKQGGQRLQCKADTRKDNPVGENMLAGGHVKVVLRATKGKHIRQGSLANRQGEISRQRGMQGKASR